MDLLSRVVTTPCVGVARALGLRRWIEHEDTIDDVVYVYTLNSAYNEKKYVEILLHYGWLFVKADVFIGE